jgi:monothiol glutaredoxin
VRAILRKYNLPYEDRDIISNPSLYAEMVEKSGQSLSPCVEVNGHMLGDVSGDEVEAYLLQAGLVQPTAAVADAPTNRACDAHHHQ